MIWGFRRRLSWRCRKLRMRNWRQRAIRCGDTAAQLVAAKIQRGPEANFLSDSINRIHLKVAACHRNSHSQQWLCHLWFRRDRARREKVGEILHIGGVSEIWSHVEDFLPGAQV